VKVVNVGDRGINVQLSRWLNHMFPLRFTGILTPSGLLRSVGSLSTDVSGKPVGPIFKGQVSKKKASRLCFCFDRLSRNVDAEQTYAA
jgi:hypothetical protein